MNKMKKLLIPLCLMFCMMFSVNVFASKQTDALKVYKNWLASSSTFNLKYEGKVYRMRRSQMKFAVVYLDNNSIPEMMVYHPALPTKLGRVMLFTYNYNTRSVQYVVNISADIMGQMGYYHRTGLLTDIRKYDSKWIDFEFYKFGYAKTSATGIGKILYLQNGSWVVHNYYTNSSPSSKSKFSAALKKKKGSTPFTKLVLRANTASNRAYYVR